MTPSGTTDEVRAAGQEHDLRRALLNLLEDAAAEKSRTVRTQQAVTNIFEDMAEDRVQSQRTQRALQNLLDDMFAQSTRAAGTERAVVNILEDMAGEKGRLESVQRAMMNLLDDFNSERARAERHGSDLSEALDSTRRAQEAAECANQELDAFSYSVAHDLRAPLRAIDGFGQILLKEHREALDEEARGLFDRILGAARRMGLLIDDLLTLSRVTRSDRVVHDVDLSDLALAVAARHRAANPGREVEVVVEPGLRARGDGRLLEVVLDNLVGNAFKFTRRVPAARVEFGRVPGHSPPAWFVRDNGAGFDMTYASTLFRPFKRLHKSDDFEGTGIGLAIVARIVERHRGRVWADAAPGRGATIAFTLEEPA